MIGSIPPLTEVKGRYVRTETPGISEGLYQVICRDCGDVTREESGWTQDRARHREAALYRTRHLARHLAALSNEMSEAAR